MQIKKYGVNFLENAPNGLIRKTDVSVAKNYLNEKELKALNQIVTMYLDYAELQAQRGIVMYMKDWIKKLDAFLQFNEKDILTNSGKVTATLAKEFAKQEYEKYKIIQDKNYISDFDKVIKKLENKQKKLKK